MPFRTYQNYEYGKSEPDARALNAIAAALGVPVASLWDDPQDTLRPPSFADAIQLLSAYQSAGQPLQGILMALATGDVGRAPLSLPPAAVTSLRALLESLKASR